MSVLDFSGLTKKKPERALLAPLKSSGGRNSAGRISVRHRGGGHKRRYRIVDFRRLKDQIPAKIAALEYDPNRSAHIALLHFVDGEKRYILAPVGIRVGDAVVAGADSDIKPGNALPLKNIPTGTMVHNIELKPGRGIWGTIRVRLLSFTMVLGVAFLLLVSFVISAVLSALGSLGQGWLPGVDWLWQLVNFVISLGVITLLFAAIYKVLPDAKVAWRDVWIGAGVTALLFTIGKTVLGLYLANAGSAYGVAGSLVVFLLWVYYSAQILFFGAEFKEKMPI